MAYLQLILGAIVRHVPLSASPGVFRVALVLHLVVAGLLALHVLGAPWRVWKLPFTARGMAWPSVAVQLLLIAQIALGVGTYVVKYSWPAWMGDYQFAASYVVQEKSFGQAITTTAHVANGSLILFVSVLVAMRATHLFGTNAVAANPAAAHLGSAIR
jgi:cytochrome c oxidase assembly protein subunit 15